MFCTAVSFCFWDKIFLTRPDSMQRRVGECFMKRWTAWLLLWLAVSGIWVGLRFWTLSAEVSAHWTPDYPREELSDTLAKDVLADSDYALLLSQTGLGPYAIDTLIALEEEERITAIQDAFFTVPTIVCEKNSPISQEEHVRRNGEIISACPIVALEEGDILIADFEKLQAKAQSVASYLNNLI